MPPRAPIDHGGHDQHVLHTFEANLSDAGLCDYLLQDLDDDPGALYNTVRVVERPRQSTGLPAAGGPAPAPKPPPAKTEEGRLRAGERRPRPRSIAEGIGTASWREERDCGRSSSSRASSSR